MGATLTKPIVEFRDSEEPSTWMIVEDATKRGGPMVVRGVFQRVNVKNINNRIYTDKLWERVLHDPNLTDKLNRRSVLGVVEHPKDGATSLGSVSHVITKLWRDNDVIYGEAEILDTPSGQIIQELFRKKIPVGISSRGRGTSEVRGGVEYVNEDTFQLDTFDFVYKPSTPGAFPQLKESALRKAFRNGATMDELIKELKRLEVAAMNVSEGTFETTEDAQGAFRQMVEADANFQAVVERMSDEQTEEHGEYLESVRGQLDAARDVAIQAMDYFVESTVNDTDRRIENARAGLVPKRTIQESENTESQPSDTAGDSALVAELQDLVAQLQEERDYYRAAADEAREVLSESGEELHRRYIAATELAEELVSRLDELQTEFDELVESHDAVVERYEAAHTTLARIAERAEETRKNRRIRDAIEETPALANFATVFKRCETDEELEEAIARATDAIGTPGMTVEDAMNVVNLGAASDGDENDNDEQLGESIELPGSFKSFTENALNNIGGGKPAALRTDSPDRVIALTAAAVNAAKKAGMR